MSVSIVVPIYRVEKYLDQCIGSLVNQTYQDIEIILVNDGSPDNCLEICRKWEKKDNRIIVLDQKNQGVSTARNNGTALSKGDWLCYVDGDDYLEPDAIEEMLKLCDEETDILITGFFVDSPGKVTPQSFLVLPDTDFVSHEERLELVKNCFLKTKIADPASVTAIGVPWAKLYRASLVRDRHILYPVEMRKMQDAIFNAEAFDQAAKICYRTIRTYHYNQNADSVTHRANPNYEKIADSVLSELDAFITEHGYEKELRPVYHARKFMFAFESVKFLYLLKGERKIPYAEKIRGTKRLMKSLHFTKEEEDQLQGYLGKAHKLAFGLYKAHAYQLMYWMMDAYLKYRNRMV